MKCFRWIFVNNKHKSYGQLKLKKMLCYYAWFYCKTFQVDEEKSVHLDRKTVYLEEVSKNKRRPDFAIIHECSSLSSNELENSVSHLSLQSEDCKCELQKEAHHNRLPLYLEGKWKAGNF